jgi:hypothetical protein
VSVACAETFGSRQGLRLVLLYYLQGTVKGDDNDKLFNASSSWFWNFMKGCSFHNIKIGGETASADSVATEEVVKDLHHIIEKEGYSPKQIFNIGGTAVF